MTTTRMRQFAITSLDTGDVTLVMGPVYTSRRGYDNYRATVISARAGLRYPVDSLVTVVPRSEEVKLPFDGAIPLVLRRRVRA